jgi:hypothetical protein
MSFQLARLKFAEITHKQIWQANLNSRVPYSFVYVYLVLPGGTLSNLTAKADAPVYLWMLSCAKQ